MTASTGRRTQVFLITDGDDNMSTRFSLDVVRDLTMQRKSTGTEFTFIQVGNTSRTFQSIQNIGGIRTMRVDSHATDIRRVSYSSNCEGCSEKGKKIKSSFREPIYSKTK